jgi:phosphodiesterase/alkaline phosphatase D-like protein
MVLALVFVASASASVPTVVTGGASGVTGTFAELSGTVNPGGKSTGWFFQYGTTTEFGSQTHAGTIAAGTSPVAVIADLNDLTPNTTYLYRLVAVNNDGGANGNVGSFTTPGPAVAPTAITGDPVSVGDTGASLGATVDPQGQPTAFTIEYGTSTAFGSITPVIALDDAHGLESVVGTATGLTPNTTYLYRVVAQNAAGVTMGAVRSFMTGPVAKPIVTTGAATAVTSGAATISATVNPQALSTSYLFEYGTTVALGSTTMLTSAGSANNTAIPVSAALTGLTANRTYLYRIVASNSLGTSTGAIMTFNTGTSGAPIVTTGTPTSLANTTATLNAQVNPHGQATTATFEWGTSTSFGHITTVVALDNAFADEPLAAGLTGLTADTTYVYRVVATNASGTIAGPVRTFNTGPGGTPIVTTGAASAVTSTSATLSATVDPHGVQTEFQFAYGQNGELDHRSAKDNAGSTNGPLTVSLPIAGLTPGLTYSYTIIATNGRGVSTGSTLTFTTLPALPARAQPPTATCCSGRSAGYGAVVKLPTAPAVVPLAFVATIR